MEYYFYSHYYHHHNYHYLMYLAQNERKYARVSVRCEHEAYARSEAHDPSPQTKPYTPRADAASPALITLHPN